MISPRLRPLISAVVLRSQSDSRLAMLASDGHQLAFTTIFERYQRELIAHAARIVRADRAEDVVQHAMLKAWGAMLSSENVAEPRAWLHRIVHNAALDAVARRGYDDSVIPPDAPAPQLTVELVEGRITAAEALAAVAGLPEAQRRALTLTALEGRSVTDAADDLQISEPALRQLVYRARSRVRNAVGGVFPLPVVVMLLEGSGVSAATAGGLTAKLATVLVVAGGGAGVVAIAERDTSPTRPRVAEAAPTPSATATPVRRQPSKGVSGVLDASTPVPNDDADAQKRERVIRPDRRRHEAGVGGAGERAESIEGPVEIDEPEGADQAVDDRRDDDRHGPVGGGEGTDEHSGTGDDDDGDNDDAGSQGPTVTAERPDASGSHGESPENDEDPPSDDESPEPQAPQALEMAEEPASLEAND